MATTKVSSKFQVVIPRDVREILNIRPGEQFQVLSYEGRIELVPIRSMEEMRGFLTHIDTDVQRDEDRV